MGVQDQGVRGTSLFGAVDTRALRARGLMFASALISPANSTVAANSVEERSYTTGLTALSLTAGDVAFINPLTALDSGMGIGWARVISANTLHVGWQNCSGGATAPTATDYLVITVKTP